MIMAQREREYVDSLAYQDSGLRGSGKQKRRTAPSRKVSRAYKLRVKCLAVMLVFIAMFGIIGAKTVHTTVVKKAEIKALEKDLQALKAENDLLQVEADKLSSVARIENAALAMGMEKPQGTIYISGDLIQQKKTVGVEETQKTASVPAPDKTSSLFDSVLKVFTGFFASTQR